jgi:hypothetical protein
MQPTAQSPTRLIPLALAAALVAASFFSSPRPAAAGPVAVALQSASSTDRAKLASIYGALADVMRRDSGRLITTTAAWRSVYRNALQLAAGGTDLVGKYPGLDEAVEKVLAQHYALENVAIDPSLSEKIVSGMTAVERQCE